MRYLLFLLILVISATARGQAPFSVVWSFNGNTGSSVSHPNVSSIGPNPQGVNNPAVGSYVGSPQGQAINYANWNTSGCNFAEWVEVGVQPVSGQTMAVTSLSFFFNRSGSGPAEIHVRSSVDNFGADIYSQTVTDDFQQANISLSGGSYAGQPGPIRFRITACRNQASGGALRLDELTINGSVTLTPLPVSLLSFTGRAEGDRVQLVWTTMWERDAERFVIDRSADLSEFIRVGDVPAKGTTDQRQDYGLTDPNPRPGPNYYRLRQIDRDGTVHSYRPISVIIRADEPAVSVFPNPAEPDCIHLRLWNADDASVRLLTPTGQAVGGQLVRTPGEADFRPAYPLPAGLYWLEVSHNNYRRRLTVLIR